MKANDLRIRNTVLFEGLAYTIFPHDISFLSENPHHEFYKPLPLDKKWLLRFGFENKILSSEFSITNFPFIIYNNEIWTDRDNDDDAICRVDFVHELQNFYFAVKKKELEISADALQ